MSSGHRASIEAPSIPVQYAPSVFGNRQYANVDLSGFLTADGRRASRTMVDSRGLRRRVPGVEASVALDPTLDAVRAAAARGLNQQAGFLEQPPDQALQALEKGRNAFYNAQAALNHQQEQEQRAEVTNRYAQSGLSNSTARGAFEAKLAHEGLLRDLATRQQALDFQNTLARRNADAQASLLSGLAALTRQPLEMANDNLIRSLMAADSANRYNADLANRAAFHQADLQLRADAENARQQEQTRRNRLNFLGSATQGLRRFF